MRSRRRHRTRRGKQSRTTPSRWTRAARNRSRIYSSNRPRYTGVNSHRRRTATDKASSHLLLREGFWGENEEEREKASCTDELRTPHCWWPIKTLLYEKQFLLSFILFLFFLYLNYLDTLKDSAVGAALSFTNLSHFMWNSHPSQKKF